MPPDFCGDKTTRKLEHCATAQSLREASRRLFDLAEQQQGFFTTKRAKAAGFAENTHPYHVPLQVHFLPRAECI
jgi:hypothetical protein